MYLFSKLKILRLFIYQPDDGDWTDKKSVKFLLIFKKNISALFESINIYLTLFNTILFETPPQKENPGIFSNNVKV